MPILNSSYYILETRVSQFDLFETAIGPADLLNPNPSLLVSSYKGEKLI